MADSLQYITLALSIAAIASVMVGIGIVINLDYAVLDHKHGVENHVHDYAPYDHTHPKDSHLTIEQRLDKLEDIQKTLVEQQTLVIEAPQVETSFSLAGDDSYEPGDLVKIDGKLDAQTPTTAEIKGPDFDKFLNVGVFSDGSFSIVFALPDTAKQGGLSG